MDRMCCHCCFCLQLLIVCHGIQERGQMRCYGFPPLLALTTVPSHVTIPLCIPASPRSAAGVTHTPIHEAIPIALP